MTKNDIRKAVIDALLRVAPEADASSLSPTANLRDELDIDSMDFLNVVTHLHTTLAVDVPEADYAKLATLDSAVAYFAAKLGVAA